jgi:methylmalonyl-CoA/ethylmalonyl-CoA epimerase
VTNEGRQQVTELGLEGITARFDHACVAAPRIKDLLPLYQELLGGRFHQGGDNVRIGYRAIQLEYADGTRFELMEPLRGSTFLDSFFRRGGGLHHVTFKVDDVLAAAAAAEAAGMTVVGLYTDDPEWKEAFVHPRSAWGVLVQLAQPGPGIPRKAVGYGLEDVLAGRGTLGNGEPSP